MCKGLSIDDVGVSRDTVYQKIRPRAGFETSDFLKEKLGGDTVERLEGRSCGELSLSPRTRERRYSESGWERWERGGWGGVPLVFVLLVLVLALVSVLDVELVLVLVLVLVSFVVVLLLRLMSV